MPRDSEAHYHSADVGNLQSKQLWSNRACAISGWSICALLLGFQTFLGPVYSSGSSRSVESEVLDVQPQLSRVNASAIDFSLAPAASKVKAVVFDMGGVLGCDTPKRFILPEVREEDWPAVLAAWDASWAKAAVTINYNMQEFWERIIKAAKLKLDWTVYNQRARESFTAYYAMLGVAHRLKFQGYQIGIISNHITDWFWHWFHTHGLAQLWPNYADVVVSADAELQKPDHAIFEYWLDKVSGGLKPEEVLFIDNTYANIKAASKVGMQGLWFQCEAGGKSADVKRAPSMNCIHDFILSLRQHGVELE
eukprot:gnl/TRDRNA2_/TRDRNA2_62781_c0_seq2.p1 gnl/TRDRNA2_/TRDRNA2_62781_c0~~gnl/TRDRNA2_/TRDRNA2_62781_c0_seq2.p1  ORF type:complete len:308 (-),score=38.21 gnl/TRDRNA2_/TRDRNA2_62781_c0_seq2:344-1267(-)